MKKSDNIIDLYENREKDFLLLSYKGEITSDVILALVEDTEEKLVTLKVPKRVQKKVCNIAIETLQNLFHHKAELSKNGISFKDEHRTIFMITQKEGVIHVHSGNYILNESKQRITKKIEDVNALNEEDLKKSYQIKLANGTHSIKGTAGLGFIDMRRKSESPLYYNFHVVNEDISFFCLDISIKLN